MAAHALTLAARLARYDAAPHTPPVVLAQWLRTPPPTRWAVLDVLADAGAATTLLRLTTLARHVAATERACGVAEGWSIPPLYPEDAPYDLEGADDGEP